VRQDALVDRLLTESVAQLRHVGLVTLAMVAQDGMRVRAAAGSNSFHRVDTLATMREEARARVAALKAEVDADPAASRTRKRAAQERAARERLERLEAALAQVDEVAAIPGKRREKIRVSTTDPEARLMKMPDGGFRPAYNVQFATDTSSQVIVGVDTVNAGTDRGQASRMRDQIEDRHGEGPDTMLVDGGFVTLESIDHLDQAGTTIIAPVPLPQDPGRDPYQPLPTDSPAIARWRQRMGESATSILYHLRAATAECVNAIARNRGLRQMTVRGTHNARTIARWFALAHNVVRYATLTAQPRPA
jgi:outer membrane murein-binding lipoprotein Lpp